MTCKVMQRKLFLHIRIEVCVVGRQLFNAQTRKLVTAREVVAKREGKVKTAPVPAETGSDEVDGDAAHHDGEGVLEEAVIPLLEEA